MDIGFTRIRLQDGANAPIQVGAEIHVFLNCAGAGIVVPPNLGARVVLYSNFRCVAKGGTGLFVPVPSVLTDWGVMLSPQTILPGGEIQATGAVVTDLRKTRKDKKGLLVIPEGTRIGNLVWL